MQHYNIRYNITILHRLIKSDRSPTCVVLSPLLKQLIPSPKSVNYFPSPRPIGEAPQLFSESHTFRSPTPIGETPHPYGTCHEWATVKQGRLSRAKRPCVMTELLCHYSTSRPVRAKQYSRSSSAHRSIQWRFRIYRRQPRCRAGRLYGDRQVSHQHSCGRDSIIGGAARATDVPYPASDHASHPVPHPLAGRERAMPNPPTNIVPTNIA